MVQLDDDIVDAERGERRQQVFHRLDRDRLARQSSLILDAAQMGDGRTNLETPEIRALKTDAVVSRRWAELIADLRKKGQAVPVLDSMIAATALAHGLTVATHNVRDFEKVGVPVLDPFVYSG